MSSNIHIRAQIDVLDLARLSNVRNKGVSDKIM